MFDADPSTGPTFVNGLMPPEAGPPEQSFYRVLLNHVSSRPGEWWIHRVAPFAVAGDSASTLRRLEDIVGSMPRTDIVVATETYLHAVCRTRLLGFRDDLEFRYSPAEGVVHVRSASRTGVFDFGVNRRRVERVRRGFEGTRMSRSMATCMRVLPRWTWRSK